MTAMFSKILAAVDESELSRSVVEAARSLAESLGAKVVLLNVGELVPAALMYDQPPLGGIRVQEESAGALERSGKKILREFSARLGQTAGKTRFEFGSPAPMICNVAREEACDLIVLGSHGSNEFISALTGSVSHEVARRAHCPVLLVK